MLLDPPEEKLHLPAILVEGADRQLPRRSSSVCIFTAALVERKCAY
jgi:hypothetical protein